MAVYYPCLGCNRDAMQTLYPEPEILTEIPHAGVRNEMIFISPTGDVTGLQNMTGNSVSSSELSFHGQGLSLSLGTQLPSAVSVSVPPFQYQYHNLPNQLVFGPNKEPFSCNVNKELLLGHSEHLSSSSFSIVGYRYENSGFVGSVLRSKFLKPTQQLLDEVVNVRRDVREANKNNKGQDFNGLNDSKDMNEDGSATNGTASNANESNGSSVELSNSERQDLQIKKTKLLSMVDEVDKRYNQYFHQMEALASSLEIVAGFGEAKPYTSMALNRISRHFRCLRDAIKGQIQIVQGRLGEQEGSGDQGERIPRLRYLDQRLRQQKALHQQLGMVRPTWRPQRGLPDNAVSILRAWLFEHFLHPYPKDSEKIMLAKQTGLAKNQVANWFINARVRLWKPMIEDIYKEEFGDSEVNSKASPENNTSAAAESSQTSTQLEREDHLQQRNNLTSSSAELKPDCIPEDEHQQHISRSADYDSLMNYHEFNLDDYRYFSLGNQQQDNRFGNPHQLHDFVI